MNDNDRIAIILLEEDEDEDQLLQKLLQRSETHVMFKNRKEEGYFNGLINTHLKEDENKFREFFRLNREQFDFVLSLVQADLKKPATNCVKFPITPEEKLAVTLRYMATGKSFRSLSFSFRISHSYISIIIKETLKALRTHLVPIFIPSPTKEELKRAASQFWERWKFPNCVGAIDGKHVRIFSPAKSGSLYFNYKDYFSIVLLALVDANYKFIALDVGSYGKEGDSSIFNKSAFGKKIFESEDFFPIDHMLPNSNKVLPYVIVGDEAFRLHKHIMKPFNKVAANSDKSKAIFNYRLCLARRVSENAFGLLSQVFRVFYTSIAIKPEVCDDLIISACCLHNLLRDGYLEKRGVPHYEYDPSEEETHTFQNFAKTGGFQQAEGFQIREQFMNFFMHEGTVEWQEKQVSKVK